MPLATFVHVSDLHFGDIDPSTGSKIYDANAPAIWANFRIFDGLLGHSYRALEYLAEFFIKLRDDDDEKAQLIVTGDLTCVGKKEQFKIAAQYLGNVLRFTKDPLGLSVTDWRDRAVPGNHDHWPGSAKIFGGPTPHLATCFPTLPFVRSPIPLSNGVSLRFIGINTDADVSPHGYNRLMARGAFATQLGDAGQQIGPPNKDEIRVLLLHHSYLYRGTKTTLEMVEASRDALEEFLVEQDIAVLLCGHTHSPCVKPFSASHQNETIEVLEACCGTTTQMDTFPKHWKTFFGRRPKRKREQNSLLVHRLLQENGQIVWETETYRRYRFGFQKAVPGPTESLEARIKVWPRT